MSAYLDWHVGMELVCVNIIDHSVGPDKARLVIGDIYIVSAMEAHSAGEYVAGVCLRRDYLFVRLVGFGDRKFFDAKLFRPIQKRKTSIEIFTALLNTHDELEEVKFS